MLQRQFSQNAEADFNFNPEFGGRIEDQYSSVKRHRTHETWQTADSDYRLLLLRPLFCLLVSPLAPGFSVTS